MKNIQCVPCHKPLILIHLLGEHYAILKEEEEKRKGKYYIITAQYYIEKYMMGYRLLYSIQRNHDQKLLLFPILTDAFGGDGCVCVCVSPFILDK